MSKTLERSVVIYDQQVANALQAMYDEIGTPKSTYIKQAIEEKLARMDVHSMTVEEIEEAERESFNSATI